MDAFDANAAIDRHAFVLHEAVVRQFWAPEIAKTGVLAGFGLVPMRLFNRVVHRAFDPAIGDANNIR